MKKRLIAAVLALIIITVSGAAPVQAGRKSIYPETMIITKISGHTVTFEPYGLFTTGYHDIRYRVNMDPEDLNTLDIIAVTMNDNMTPDFIPDDIISDMRYSGHFTRR